MSTLFTPSISTAAYNIEDTTENNYKKETTYHESTRQPTKANPAKEKTRNDLKLDHNTIFKIKRKHKLWNKFIKYKDRDSYIGYRCWLLSYHKAPEDDPQKR